MATNIVHEDGDQLFRLITSPASGAKANDAVLCGQRPGVALTDQDANGYATVKFNGSADLPVKGTNGSNTAVAAGDIVYWATGTPTLTKTTSGVRFGYAAAAVGSGATATIQVDLGY